MLFTLICFVLQGLIFKLMTINGGEVSVSTVIVGIALISIVFMWELSKTCKHSSDYIIIFGGYVFRLFLLFWDIYARHLWALPGSGSDSEMYLRSAISSLTTGDVGRGGVYSSTIAVIFRLFGNQRLIAQYVNVLLAVLVILICRSIFIKLKLNRKTRTVSLFLAAFLPNFAIINAILLRETIIIFLLTLSIYFFIGWWLDNKKYKLLLAMLFPLLAATYHSGALSPIAGYVLFLALFDRKHKRFRLNAASVVSAALLTVAVYIVLQYFGDALLRKVRLVDTTSDIVGTTETVRGGSGYDVGFKISNPTLSLVVNTPVRLVYFLFSPLPWAWRGMNDVIAFMFSSLFFGYSLVIAFKALRTKESQNRHLIYLLLFVAAASAFIFAWGVSNAGTALRHREKYTVFYVVLFALSYENKIENKNKKQKNTLIKNEIQVLNHEE